MTKKKIDLSDLFIRDAGQGFENLRRAAHRDIIFYADRDVKTFKDLKKFIEENNVPPKTVAVLLAKHIKPDSNWMNYQILNNPKQLKWIKRFVAMQKKLGTKKLMISDWLEDFADATGYEIPKDLKTFRNNVWSFKAALGVQRKKDGSFTAARMEIELLRKLKNKKQQSFWDSKINNVEYSMFSYNDMIRAYLTLFGVSRGSKDNSKSWLLITDLINHINSFEDINNFFDKDFDIFLPDELNGNKSKVFQVIDLLLSITSERAEKHTKQGNKKKYDVVSQKLFVEYKQIKTSYDNYEPEKKVI